MTAVTLPTSATTAQSTDPAVPLLDELQALLTAYDADLQGLINVSHQTTARAVARQRSPIELAIKATTLESLGGDTGSETDLQQRYAREIRDGLIAMVRRTWP